MSKMIFTGVLLVAFHWIAAQQRIDHTFQFIDGAYFSNQQLIKNKPNIEFFNFKPFGYQLDSKSNLLFFDRNTLQAFENKGIIDSIWTVVVGGKPFIKMGVDSNAVYFVKYHLIGKVSYFYYPVYTDKPVEMFVHNPYTGDRIGYKTVTNKQKILIKKILDLSTGEIQDYTQENVLVYLKRDERLRQTLDQPSEQEVEDKLFKSLKIYNDRNPIYIKK